MEVFLRRLFFHFKNTDYPISQLIASDSVDLLSFLESKAPLTRDVFELIVLQLLGFIPNVDFTSAKDFVKRIAFPINFDSKNIINPLHHLLATRMKSGMTLIDHLVSQGLLPMDNHYHYFNGKSLATFDTNDLIREVVYVETPVDTDEDGKLDLIKVNIIRPKTSQTLPTVMTASPYHEGVNEVANDKRLYKMEADLTA